MYRIVIFSVVIIVSGLTINAQSTDQNIIAKFIILDVTDNGRTRIMKDEAFFVFYQNGDGKIYLANVWPDAGSQSYGPIYRISEEEAEETMDTYKTFTSYFNWSYANSYDDNRGTAKIALTKVYKPQGIIFSLAMITEDLDVSVYKGYMENSLNLEYFDR